MKKYFKVALAGIVTILFISISVFATNDEIRVYLDGEKIEFDIKPQTINGRTMVPIRAIFEAMGATVSWDDATETAVCIKEETVIKMTVDNNVMSINDTVVNMDVSPVVINERTLAPARYVAEAFGAEVNWSSKNKVVSLTTNGIPVYADYYNVPDIGKFFGVELLCEYDWKENPGIHTYVYDFEEIYKVGEEKTEYVNTLPDVMIEYGYQQIQQHDDSDYFDISVLYGNLDNAEYVVRIVWCVLDNSNRKVTLVEVEQTKHIINQRGDYRTVPLTELSLWETDGWAVDNEVLMYASDGRTICVRQSEVEAYKNIGWYTEPVVLMYATDGRTLYVVQSEIDAHKNVGWYLEPVQELYASDGSALVVPKTEVEAHKKVGWYESSKDAISSVYPKQGVRVLRIYKSINSVGGVEPTIVWRNDSGKTIKYIYFTVVPYNAVNDIVSCRITGDTYTTLKCTGPYKTFDINDIGFSSEIYLDKGLASIYKTSSEPLYAIPYSMHYLLNPKKYYLTENDYNYIFNNESSWDPIWYNYSVDSIKITKVNITYMDGSTETIYNPCIWETIFENAGI